MLSSRLVNHRLPSGPAVIPLLVTSPGNVVMTPLGVMRPTRWLPKWTNQRLPSGPAVMSRGQVDLAGRVDEGGDGAVVGVDAADAIGEEAVNQRFPSGPSTMSAGPATLPAGSVNVVIAPSSGSMRPIDSSPKFVNHTLPSGPVVIPVGVAKNEDGTGYVVMSLTAAPAGAVATPSVAPIARAEPVAMAPNLRSIPPSCSCGRAASSVAPERPCNGGLVRFAVY